MNRRAWWPIVHGVAKESNMTEELLYYYWNYIKMLMECRPLGYMQSKETEKEN